MRLSTLHITLMLFVQNRSCIYKVLKNNIMLLVSNIHVIVLYQIARISNWTSYFSSLFMKINYVQFSVIYWQGKSNSLRHVLYQYEYKILFKKTIKCQFIKKQDCDILNKLNALCTILIIDFDSFEFGQLNFWSY